MRILRAGVFATFICLWVLQAAGAADTNPPPRLAVDLRDGSHVIGTCVEDNFRFQSVLLGNLKLAVKDIRSVDCTATNAAKLTTVNGDTLTVSFADPDFKIKTSFGKIEIAANSVRKLTVVNASKISVGNDGLVLFWAGNGDTKHNIGTDPDTAASLDAGQPVMVRNNPALVSMQETRQLTYEAWIKPDSFPQEFPVLVSKGGNQPPSAYGGYEIYLDCNGNHDLSFVSSSYDFSTDNGWINPHLGEWIHVAFTIDDRSKAAAYYVNGTLVSDGHNNGVEDDLNFAFPADLYIGSPDPASHPNRARFDGEMRNVSLYNQVRTADEIRTDFNAGHPD